MDNSIKRLEEILSVRIFFVQAEDGIRDLVRSRGLGDVYKRQCPARVTPEIRAQSKSWPHVWASSWLDEEFDGNRELSLIHI